MKKEGIGIASKAVMAQCAVAAVECALSSSCREVVREDHVE